MASSSSSYPSQALFLRASQDLTSLPQAVSLSTSTKLRLYGLYKVLTTPEESATRPARPGFWDPTGRSKWDAWDAAAKEVESSSGSSSGREEELGKAREEYVAIVRGLGWDLKESDLRKGNDSDSEDSVDLDHLSSDDEADEQARQANKPKVATGSKGGGVSLSGGLGNGVSTMAIEEEDENSASDLPPHLHIIVPDLSLLREYLAAHPDEINKLDDYGYSPLHLAADRNRPEFVKFLLEAGADKNLPDLEGMTALEMAELNGSDWAEVAALL